MIRLVVVCRTGYRVVGVGESLNVDAGVLHDRQGTGIMGVARTVGMIDREGDCIGRIVKLFLRIVIFQRMLKLDGRAREVIQPFPAIIEILPLLLVKLKIIRSLRIYVAFTRFPDCPAKGVATGSANNVAYVATLTAKDKLDFTMGSYGVVKLSKK